MAAIILYCSILLPVWLLRRGRLELLVPVKPVQVA